MIKMITREQFAIAIKIDTYRALYDIPEDVAFDIYKLYNGNFEFIEERLEALEDFEDPRNKLEERIGYIMKGKKYWLEKPTPTPTPQVTPPFEPSPVPVKVTSTVDPTKLPTAQDIENVTF